MHWPLRSNRLLHNIQSMLDELAEPYNTLGMCSLFAFAMSHPASTLIFHIKVSINMIWQWSAIIRQRAIAIMSRGLFVVNSSGTLHSSMSNNLDSLRNISTIPWCVQIWGLNHLSETTPAAPRHGMWIRRFSLMATHHTPIKCMSQSSLSTVCGYSFMRERTILYATGSETRDGH